MVLYIIYMSKREYYLKRLWDSGRIMMPSTNPVIRSVHELEINDLITYNDCTTIHKVVNVEKIGRFDKEQMAGIYIITVPRFNMPRKKAKKLCKYVEYIGG